MASGLEGRDAFGNVRQTSLTFAVCAKAFGAWLASVLPSFLCASQNFKSPDELWHSTKDADGTHETWYKKAVQYWDQQEPSYDGVLGGFGHVSDADVADSRQLLLKV